MAYVDYTFYTGTFKGNAIAQADFDRLATRASETIDQITFGRAAAVISANTDAAVIAAIKKASCAVAEQIQGLEASGGAVQSETVGRHSVTFLSKLDEAERYYLAAKRYLWEYALLFRGLNENER